MKRHLELNKFLAGTPLADDTLALPRALEQWGRIDRQGLVYRISRQAAAYLGVSFLGTAAHFSLMTLMVWGFDLPPVAATGCGAILGAAIIYWLNFHFTFRSSTSHQKAVVRFVAMAAAGALINGLVLASALGAGWRLVPSQVLATAIQFCFGFMVSRWWIY